MKVKLLIIVLVLLSTGMAAQKVTLQGVVKDSLGNPLELANVVAINKETKGISSYGITDYQGRFKLQLEMGKTYLVKSSYVGFETGEEEISPQLNETITRDFILNEKADALSAVEVVHEMPVTVSGDTIVYKADAFTDGKEKKLQDVLEKLPGFEIDENGQLKVQGKKVEKVLVEGKEFFDGDTKMATQNIPANAVDKVQLLRNYNDIGPMSGLNNNEERLALNIKLQEGKKNLLFGDVTAGAGSDERYLVHPNLFYYSPKASVNFIGDLNNIGQQAFTMQDYFRFSGGFSSLGNRSGSGFNISSDETGLAFMQNNRARNIETKLGALNLSYNPNKKWSFSGFGIATGVNTDMNSISRRTYIRQEGNNQEVLTSDIRQENVSGLGKIDITYTPDNSLHLGYEAFVKTSDIEQQNNRLSVFDAFENNISDSNSQQPFSVEQRANAFFAPNERNVYSAEINHLYKRQDPFYRLQTDQQPFNGIIPVTDAETYQLFQDKNIYTNKLDALLNYYYVINPTNHINFNAGTTYSHQTMTSSITQKLDDNQETTFDDNTLKNDFAYDYSDAYFGARYKTKLGKLTLNPGLNLHVYKVSDHQLPTTRTRGKTLLLPEFYAKYEFRQSESLTLNYSVKAQFTDIQNIATGTIISGYNSLFAGNRNLDNSWYHDLQLNYFNFNMFNFTNIYAGATYQKKYDDISTGVNYIGLDRVSFPQNISKPNEVLSVFGNIEKRFTFMKLKFDTNLSHSTTNNQIDGNLNKNTSFTQVYKASAETNFKTAPNLEIGFSKTLNNYKSGTGNDRFITNKPFANLEAVFLKYFTLTADYEYNDYKSKRGSDSYYDFLNAAIYFQGKDSPWEFKVSGMNLLNTTQIRQDGFSDNLISTYGYLVQPRYFVFSIKYDL